MKRYAVALRDIPRLKIKAGDRLELRGGYEQTWFVATKVGTRSVPRDAVRLEKEVGGMGGNSD